MASKVCVLTCLALFCLAPLFSWAGKATGTDQSTRLYTASDPAAGGGIEGTIAAPDKAITGVFALPQGDYKRVYRGNTDSDGRTFRFAGLPPGKYDLVVLYADAFYEGLALTRETNSLTAGDQKSIETAIMKSTPFFDTKKIHRCEGTTGHAGQARCVLQEVRTRPVTLQSAEVRADIQIRSLKLALPEDVGSQGWSLVNTREIVRQEVTASETKGLLPHQYREKLGGIRVIDSVKALGTISL